VGVDGAGDELVGAADAAGTARAINILK